MNPSMLAALGGGGGGGESLQFNPIAKSQSGPAYSGTNGWNGGAGTTALINNGGQVGSYGIYALAAAAFIGLIILLKS